MTPLFSRGWMSRALVAFSVALVSLAFASIAIAQATYEGREERSLNRAPVLAGTSDEARLAFAERTPILPGGPVTVVYFDPNGSIEPPPGLVGWPAPGSVAVSPAMSSDGVVVSEVFGEISAQIQPEGLASPNERLIYVVPNDAIPRSSGWQQASGIGLSENLGDDDLWTFGEIFEVAPIESLVLTLLVFLVLPSLWLLITTTGLNARADSDRAVVLEVLGMSPLRIARVRFRALLPALLLGNLVSVLIVIAVGSWGWRVWGIDWRIYGPDLSSHVGVICGALLVGALLGALIILVRCWPPRPRGGTVVSPSPPRQEFRRVALAFLVLLVLSVLLYAGAVTGSEWSAFGTSVLALGSAASASLICGYLLWRLGAPLRCWGARRGSPAAIVAAGEMHSGARDPVRLAAGGVIAMLLLSILTLLVVGNAQVT